MLSITPLLSAEYFAEITKTITTAAKGDTILLMSMTFDPRESGMIELVEAMETAGERGANVTLIIDAHSFMFEPNGWPTGPVLWRAALNKDSSRYYKHKFKIIDRLEAAGCTVHMINSPKRTIGNPYGGRSHIKTTIINSTVYLGGCNLSGDESIDMMVRFDDQKSADYLYEHCIHIATVGNAREALTKDLSFELDGATTLLLDSGKRKISLIYDTALKLIDDAHKSIVMTCQFFPDKRTVTHLEKAIARGVDVTLYFNDPSKQIGPTAIGHHLVAAKAKHLSHATLSEHKLPTSKPHMHLKLIATEQGAIIGSHNYVEAGVKFGTAEIALVRMDQGFSETLVSKARTLLD